MKAPNKQDIEIVHHVADGVYISSSGAIQLVPRLRQAGITSILKLYYHIPDWPDDFLVCNNPLRDGEFIPQAVLQRGVSFIKEQVDAGQAVLVLCVAGISRSSTFVLAYLIERGYHSRDAWRLLHSRHIRAMPLPLMWQSLLTHYDLPYTVRDTYEWMIEM
jgi:protein-tyrosine phosphatase